MTRTESKKQVQARLNAARENDGKESFQATSSVWNYLIFQFGFRQQMPVAEVMIYSDGTGYYICPRCHVTMDREFVDFCDCCGQHLSWKNYRKAKKISPGQHTTLHS